MSIQKVERDFYERDPVTVARELLGKYIFHKINGQEIRAKITDVEAYCGEEDKGCHAFGGRRTSRTEVLYWRGGTSYVYLIYGMYDCFNVVTETEDNPSAVLIRGVEACEDSLDIISENRFKKLYKDLSSYQRKNFLNGPGKVCRGLKITRLQNGVDVCGENLYIYEDTECKPVKIEEAKRINIDYAEEYADKLWRFYIKQ